MICLIKPLLRTKLLNTDQKKKKKRQQKQQQKRTETEQKKIKQQTKYFSRWGAKQESPVKNRKRVIKNGQTL